MVPKPRLPQFLLSRLSFSRQLQPTFCLSLCTKETVTQTEYPCASIPSFSFLDQAPANIHLGLQALYRFQLQNGRLPNRRCNKDADAFIQLCSEINQSLQNKVRTEQICKCDRSCCKQLYKNRRQIDGFPES